MTQSNTHPMISLSRPAYAALLAVLLAGCHGSASSSSDSSATAADKSKLDYTVIRAAHVPTSTLVTTPGRLEIVDVGEDRSNPLNKVLLKKTKVAPNTLVTANPTGITLNTTDVTTERIDRRHTLEFRLYK